MPAYACRKCNESLDVKPDRKRMNVKEGKGQKDTVTVRCPKCGEQNSFEVDS